jgi:predicted HicB family RNase H-like nuclease
MATIKKELTKHSFALRITGDKTFSSLYKKAKEKKWSVNTLINSILEESLKKR